MKRFTRIGVALLAVSALGAVMASVAQAEPAPSFTVGGTRLIAGKTHNIDVKQFGAHNFILGTPALGVKIECTGLSSKEGVLLGSNPESPGRDDEVLVFSGCSLVAGNGVAAGCHLAATAGGAATSTTIETAVKSEQVESVVSGTKGNQLLEEFVPTSGATFVTIFFGPAVPPCEVLEGKVEGSPAGEVLLDNTSEGTIELGQAPQQRTSWLLRFPSAQIASVWLISSGVGKIQKTGLTLLSQTSNLEGTALTLLASTKFVPEVGLWSPLP